MNDLERAVRQTLTARVSHLTDERLDAETTVSTVRRRSMRVVVLPLAAAAAVAAIAVGVVVAVNSDGRGHQSAAGSESALVGAEWRLESITQDGRTTPMPSGVYPVIRFDGKGNTTGNDGCNYFDGPVAISGTTMRTGQLMSTAMGCLGVRGEVGLQFMATLTTVDHWAVDYDKLRLTGADTVMTFRVRASSNPTQGITPTASATSP